MRVLSLSLARSTNTHPRLEMTISQRPRPTLPTCSQPACLLGDPYPPRGEGGGGRGAVVLPRNLTNRSSRLSHQDEQPSGSHWQISAPSRPRRFFPSILRLSHQFCRFYLAMEFYHEKVLYRSIPGHGSPPPLPRPNRASIPTRQPLELVT